MTYAAPTTAPTKPAEFQTWLIDELRHITDAFSEVETNAVLFKEWSADLDKLFDGLVIFADGNNFDPGQGRGFYGRHGGVWNKLDFTDLLIADPGTLLLTGAEADLRQTGFLTAEPAALLFTGGAAHLFRSTTIWDEDAQCWDDDNSVWDDAIHAQPGALLLSGFDAVLFVSTPFWNPDIQPWDNDNSIWDDYIVGEPGALILAGASATFITTLNAQPGALALTGAVAALGRAMTALPGTLTLAGADATLVVTSPFWNDDAEAWDDDATNWDD